MTAVPVRKTKYRKRKVKRGKINPGDHASQKHLNTFPPRRLEAGKDHFIGQDVKLLKPVCALGDQGEELTNFPQAVPGEYGVYQGQNLRYMSGGMKEVCVIKLKSVTAYLPDDGTWFEWL